jgi:hypothetical protein
MLWRGPIGGRAVPHLEQIILLFGLRRCRLIGVLGLL